MQTRFRIVLGQRSSLQGGAGVPGRSSSLRRVTKYLFVAQKRVQRQEFKSLVGSHINRNRCKHLCKTDVRQILLNDTSVFNDAKIVWRMMTSLSCCAYRWSVCNFEGPASLSLENIFKKRYQIDARKRHAKMALTSPMTFQNEALII